MTHSEKARDLFLEGYNCAQAVFGAYAQEAGMSHEDAMKLASSFGGGMGGLRDTCGAVSGMIAAAGLKWGYADSQNLEEKTAHYARVRRLIEAFEAEHGSHVCRELLAAIENLKTDPSERTPEYYRTRPCARFVETAARLLEEQE